MAQRYWSLKACLRRRSWMEVEITILSPECASVDEAKHVRSKIFRDWKTADNNWCYKEGKPKFGAFVLAGLGCPTFYWMIFPQYLGRFYQSRRDIWSQVSPYSIQCIPIMWGIMLNFNFSYVPDLRWEQSSEINGSLNRKWYPCGEHQGVTIIFFQFYKMDHFFFKCHDSNVIHCQLSVILMAKFITLHVTDVRDPQEENVLTFFTHNIGLIVYNFNLSKNTFEKSRQWLIYKWQWPRGRW